MVRMNVPTTGNLRVDKHERGEEEPRHTQRGRNTKKPTTEEAALTLSERVAPMAPPQL